MEPWLKFAVVAAEIQATRGLRSVYCSRLPCQSYDAGP